MAPKTQARPQLVNTAPPIQPRTLPDLATPDAMEQIKALMLHLSPEQRKTLGKELQAPKRDMGKLLEIKAEVQAFCSERFYQVLGESLDGKDAFGIVWKAAWPKKYYHIDATGQDMSLPNGAPDIWSPGGYANSKPDWVKNGEYRLIRLEMVDGKEVEIPEQDEQESVQE
jgi:hypothetical protein